jgi:hypothetical protein
MTDNVAITAGSGTTIATDDVSGVQFQRVKLVDGTLDSSAVIPGDATNGLRVSRAADTVPTLVTMQSAQAANGNGTTLNVLGYSSVVALVTGTFVLTIEFEGSLDDTTWVNIAAERLDTVGVLIYDIISVGTYRIDVTGFKSLRARVLGFVSGSVTVKALLTQSPTTHPFITNTGFTAIGTVGQDGPAGTVYPLLIGGRASAAVPFDMSADNDAVPAWFLRNGAIVAALAGNLVSTNNSSSTTLGSGAAFTGTADDITDYAVVTVSVFANVASATDGLSIQQSSNGTNWDVADVYTVAAGAAKHVTVQCALRYLRVVYTNTGSAQSSFRLQTILHRVNQRGSSVRPGDARSNEQDMEEVIAYQALFNGTTWDRQRGDTANGLDVDVTRMPAITKGTQGTTGVATQDLKDAGRVAVRYYATAAAPGTTGTETILTLTKSSGTAATSTSTSMTPTSGKTFRIQYIVFASRGNATATIQATVHSLRINTAGAAIVTSTPIVLQARTATAAVASAWDRIQIDIPDGYEIPGDGTLSFCVTVNSTYTTNAPTVDVLIVGYEY